MDTLKLVGEAYGRKTQIEISPDADIHELLSAMRGIALCLGYFEVSWEDAVKAAAEEMSGGALRPIERTTVESNTDPDEKYYITKWSDGMRSCTCKGFQFRRHCTHLEEN